MPITNTNTGRGLDFLLVGFTRSHDRASVILNFGQTGGTEILTEIEGDYLNRTEFNISEIQKIHNTCIVFSYRHQRVWVITVWQSY